MLFCPTCANCLLVEKISTGLGFFCKTCPYTYRVSQTVTKKLNLERKKVDDVMGGDEAWENADTIDVRCMNCYNNTANFYQVQLRSADEPMTVFYRCTKCKHRWHEN